MSMNSLSLYFHIPFCKVKCIYCDFYSVVNRDQQIPVFVDTLINELQTNPPPADQYDRVSTIYFGGGTPSMLSGHHLETILTSIENTIPFSEDIELTLEANPGEVDEERLTDYKSLGVNRVSFGIQSFQDAQLERLGRLHRSEHNVPSVQMARKAGFDNISVDLIYHLPEQSLGDFNSDLQQMIALDAEHISIYSLTVEQNTPLFQFVEDGRISMTPDELDAEMYRNLCEQMDDAGFRHYEVSNFGLPGFESRHNSNYWNGTHYYSYGPSAHSYNGDFRWWNVRDLSEYFIRMRKTGNPVQDREYLDTSILKDEFLLTRLRTDRGINLQEWKTKFKEPLPAELRQYFEFVKSSHPGWIQITDASIRLTEEGWLFTDTIIGEAVECLNSN